MDARVRELVKATIPVLKEHGVALTTYFYQRMFRGNPELTQLFNRSHSESGKQATALAMSVLAYAENIDDPSVLAPVITLIANKHASIGIRAEHYPIVGKHLLASIKEVLGEAASDELINAWGVAYGVLADVLIEAEGKLYTEAANRDGGWSGWRPFKIIDKVFESSEIVSLYLAPTDGGPLPAFLPGQYITLRIFVPEWGVTQPRQYTLSDAPGLPHFRISVKREDAANGTPAGLVSNLLHANYNKGDIIDVAPPFGNFYLHEDRRTPVVLLSGGVGVTPMISMLKHLIATAKDRQVEFIHACRNADVLAFGARLHKAAADNPQLQVRIFHDSGPIAEFGVIDTLDLGKLGTLPPQADYYLCGPEGFLKTHIARLHELGVDSAHIHAEVFTTGGVAV